MGYSSSQVRLMALTARKNDIGRELQHCSLEKMSLSRDMKRVTTNYQNALNTKVYKWSNNAGATYTDLSYATLMKPGAANKNNPYLITNSSGRVVLDAKYEQYAAMISPDGKPGGDWESNRTKILSQLTGLSEDKINNALATSEAVNSAAAKVNAAQEKLDEVEGKEPVNSDTAIQFFKRVGSAGGYDIGQLYNSASTWTDLGNAATAKSKLTNILNGVAENMKNFLTDEDYEALKSACKNYTDTNDHYFGGTSEADKQGLEAGTAGIKKNGDNYSVNLKIVLDSVLGSYKEANGSYGQTSMGQEVFYTRDRGSQAWQNWNTEYQALQTELNAAKEEHKAAVNNDNMAMTSEEESNVKFYDRLFSAIAANGWVTDSQISDNDYLNNMFQNNQYFITTMVDDTDSEGNPFVDYNQKLASDFDNIVQVNDSAYQQEALVEYEHEKAIINEKESRIDVRMQNLETEQSAINEMIKGVEKVRDDNKDRTFSIFG